MVVVWCHGWEQSLEHFMKNGNIYEIRTDDEHGGQIY